MTKTIVLICVLFSLLILTTGCSVRQGDFSLLSTKKIELSHVDLQQADFTRDVEGSSSRLWFLFIPFGSTPTLEKACDAALERGRGDFMTSVVAHSSTWHIILFGWESWTVKGDIGDSMSAGAPDSSDRDSD